MTGFPVFHHFHVISFFPTFRSFFCKSCFLEENTNVFEHMMMPLTRVSNSLQRWSLYVSLTRKSRLRPRRPSSFPGGNSRSARKTKSLASRPNDLDESIRIPFFPVNEIDFGTHPVFHSVTYDCLNAFLLELAS